MDTSVRTSWTAGRPLRLAVAVWVEGELAQQDAVMGEHADAEVGDQDDDLCSGVPSADADFPVPQYPGNSNLL